MRCKENVITVNDVSYDEGRACLIAWKRFTLLSFADNSGPTVVYCPPDQNITATRMKTTVTWQSPQFKDNSNSPLVVRCSQKSGTEFYWGTWNVHCTAYDNNPNNKPALCQFTLTLKRKYNKALEFMLARINIFWALLRPILAVAASRG